MLKKLLGRHRSVRIGATLVGASALAIGFASPALAAQSVNNGNAANANAQNALVVQGGSNTSFLVMQAEADIFNRAPGCDLTSGGSGTEQELDYGCPGLNGNPGVNQSAPTVVSQSGSTAIASKNVTVTNSTGWLKGMVVTDSGGAIPAGDTIKSITSGTVIKLKAAATATVGSDTINVTTVPAYGENGFTNFGQQNPFNDVLVEEPALGSSNGVQELEGTGSASVVGHSNTTNDPISPPVGPVPVSPIDIARSSRAPNLSGAKADFKGLNFVAFAEDAVSYIYWTKVGGVTTPSDCIQTAKSNNLDHATTLTNIWNGTYTTWGQVCGTASTAPVAVYWSQNGSGTEATWASMLSLGFNASGSNSAHVIFENETSEILKNGDQANAISFFSYGKYKQICTPNGTLLSTNVLCTGATTSAIQMGNIDGVTPSPTSIDAQLPGGTSPFPGDRFLYNVYANGSNPLIPASSPAALNMVSEDGFLCKPSTATDIDPNSGLTYLSEIDKAITSQGFFPLGGSTAQLQVEDGQSVTTNPNYNTTHAGIGNPAWTALGGSKYDAAQETGSPWNFSAGHTDTDSSAVNGTYNAYFDGVVGSHVASTTNPVGYCITLTTDGNASN